MAASEAVKELMWIRVLIRDILQECDVRAMLYIDNQGALKLIKNPEYHSRTKHIDVRVHFIREKYYENLFDISYIPTNEQLADIFTKPLCKEKFEYFKVKINII